jgi:hypothetical protein
VNRRRRSRFVPLSAAVTLAAAATPAVAAAERILLPSAHLQAQVTPPLRGSPVFGETRFPLKGIVNTERVLVGIDANGKSVSVDVVQRLTLNGLGDYTFAVPGPVADVTSAPGSASEPGLRRDAILWSGFSSGRKTLAARAALRVTAAVPVLPFRLTIAREGDALTLRGENVSQLPSLLLAGASSAAQTAAALDETRRASRRGPVLQNLYVDVPRAPHAKQEQILAPLRITGEVRFAGGRRFGPFDYVLGDGGPRSFVLRVPSVSGEAMVRILVRAVTPTKLLTPPGGSKTWVDAVRRHRVDPARLLELASRARLSLARAIDYQAFLINPDPRGTSKAVYVYETASKSTSAAAPRPVDSGGNGWTTVGVAALLLIGASGLVVLWAHH